MNLLNSPTNGLEFKDYLLSLEGSTMSTQCLSGVNCVQNSTLALKFWPVMLKSYSKAQI